MSEPIRVLVIDDEHEIVRGISLRLRAAGYGVHSALNGRDGLKAAVQYQPSVIVLDVRMPGMTGLEVLEELRKRTETRNISVIVASANVVEDTRDNALALGARCFLEKPYQAVSLLSAIKSAHSPQLA